MRSILPPQDGETYDEFYAHADLDVKKEMDKIKNEVWKKTLTITYKETIQKELDIAKKHHLLIIACAKIFADTSLSEKTGYQFYFTEPLIELSSQRKNNRIFDLIIANESDCSAIFIECKSSDSDAKETIKQISSARDLVIENLEYLSKKLGFPLEKENIEYVYCVFYDHSQGILNSLIARSTRPNTNHDTIANELILWEYLPGAQEIRLYSEHQHNNSQLTEMLQKRYGDKDLANQFDLPYYLNLHPFLIINDIIIGYCYTENYQNERITEKKVISKNQFFKHLVENAYFGLNPEETKKILKEKMEYLIEFGVRCDLFEIIDEDHIKIKCPGLKPRVVIENIREKFITNWSDCKAEERAKIETLNDIKRKLAKQFPTLEDFDNAKNN